MGFISSQGLDASLILSFVFSHNHHIDLKRAPVELNNTFNTNTIKCQSYTSKRVTWKLQIIQDHISMLLLVALLAYLDEQKDGPLATANSRWSPQR